jgi:hypothetical protein
MSEESGVQEFRSQESGVRSYRMKTADFVLQDGLLFRFLRAKQFSAVQNQLEYPAFFSG